MIDYTTWLTTAMQCLAEGESPKRDAEILLSFVTGKSRAFIIAFSETQLTPAQSEQLGGLLDRRVRGEPIAYLIGEREFWSLPLRVSPATLIPRPDTELLVALALERIPKQGGNILDLGSGTGAIGLALASERADCWLTGVDIQPEATVLASSNASRLGLTNINFCTGDWFTPVVGQRFALIVSNPPYIDECDPHLQQGDVRFEPRSALVAPAQGLADIQWISALAPHYLQCEGWLLLEHGWQQGCQVRELLQQVGFSHISTEQDHGSHDRVTLGCWPGDERLVLDQ